MVTRYIQRLLRGSIFISSIILLEACNVDLFGLFISNDLDTRLQDRNTFHFLNDRELNLSLPEEYSFIVLTDTHIEDGNAHGLERLASALIDSDKFVVVNGDITQYGSREDIRKFIEIARSLNIACYPVVGNHDIYFNGWLEWKDLIGSTSYRIGSETSNTSLFVLDSANGSLGRTQLEWLEEELKNTKGRVFVFTHTNLFIKSPVDIVQFTDTRERAWIISMLKGRGDAVFMGHIHRRIIIEAAGVPYITIEDYKSNTIFCRVYVSSEGTRYEFSTL